MKENEMRDSTRLSKLQIEAFVEENDYRWRIFESDPGVIDIQYQEWDQNAGAWVNVLREEAPNRISFSGDAAKDICDAIMRVAAQHDAFKPEFKFDDPRDRFAPPDA